MKKTIAVVLQCLALVLLIGAGIGSFVLFANIGQNNASSYPLVDVAGGSAVANFELSAIGENGDMESVTIEDSEEISAEPNVIVDCEIANTESVITETVGDTMIAEREDIVSIERIEFWPEEIT